MNDWRSMVEPDFGRHRMLDKRTYIFNIIDNENL